MIYNYESSTQEWKKTRFLEQIFDSQEKVLDRIFTEEEGDDEDEDDCGELTVVSNKNEKELEEVEEETKEVTQNAAEGPVKETKGKV